MKGNFSWFSYFSFMKYLVVLSLFLVGCTAKISPYFQGTLYMKGYHIEISNEVLNLQFTSPADIKYQTDPKDMKKALRRSKMPIKDSVMIYGICATPNYEMMVTVSDSGSKYALPIIAFDTLIKGKTIQFVGIPDGNRAALNLKNDLEKMMRSIHE